MPEQWCSEFIQDLQISYEFLLGSAIVLVVLGVLNVFLGYPIFRVVLCIFAGLAGGTASYVFAFAAFGGDIAASLIVAVTVGLLSVIALYKLYLMSVFLAGGALGWFLSYTVMEFVGLDNVPLVITISGVVCGLIALMIQKFAIILATSLFGAVYTTLGVAQLVGHGIDPKELAEDPGNVVDWSNPDAKVIIMAVCVVVLALGGILVQYKITSTKKRKHEIRGRRDEGDKSQVIPADESED